MNKTQTFRSTFDVSALAAVLAQGAVVFAIAHTGGLTIYALVIAGATASTTYARLVEKDRRSEAPRSWKNSLANTGASTVLLLVSSIVSDVHWASIITAASIASLSSGLSDTLSHEFGVLYGGTPRIITSFAKASPGENGAISLFGTAVGAVSAFGLCLLGATFGLISPRQAAIAGLCSMAGNTIDSILGATLEKRGVLDNNGVNTACTISAGVLVLLIYASAALLSRHTSY